MLDAMECERNVSSGTEAMNAISRGAAGFTLLLTVVTACDTPDRVLAPNVSRAVVSGELTTYMVAFRKGVGNPDALANDLAKQHGGRLRFVYRSAVQGFAAELSDAAADALRQNPKVAIVERDGVGRPSDTQSPVPSWGLDRIDQRDLPLSNSYTYPNTGAGVTVYVIDTGIRYSHQDFGGRAVFGADYIGDGLNGGDCWGHGTHVAGTIGGTAYGVAKGVTLVSVRVFACSGNQDLSVIAAAVDWVTANAVRPAVVNMSLSGSAHAVLDAAVAGSIASGLTYTVAAANFAFDACAFSPARVPNAITVGASDQTDTRANFSNYGPCLDLFAPGVSIISTYHTADDATASFNGTSMAAPHVAGVAAMALSANPTWTPTQVRDGIVGSATTNAVSNAGQGTTRLLLFADWSQCRRKNCANGNGNRRP